jgi:hypothetical protein
VTRSTGRTTAEAQTERRGREAAEARLATAQAELAAKAEDWSQRLQLAEAAAVPSNLEACQAELARAEGRATGLEAELTEWKAAVGALQEGIAAGDRRFEQEATERRRLHNQLQELRGNIRVLCRVRPLDSYSGGGEVSISQPEGGTDDDGGRGKLEVANPLRGRQNQGFEFDRVFGGGAGRVASNADIFAEVQPAVISALDGFNVCCFAYGQTGSGKTHTMGGDGSDPRGVTSLAVDALYGEIDARRRAAGAGAGGARYTVEAALVEVYNETLRDLLASPAQASPRAAGRPSKLEIRHGADGGIEVPGLTARRVPDAAAAAAALSAGSSNRAVGVTDMNQHSSRSHLVFIMTLQVSDGARRQATTSKLILVDLAGSERVHKSQLDGQRLKEAQVAAHARHRPLGGIVRSRGGADRAASAGDQPVALRAWRRHRWDSRPAGAHPLSELPAHIPAR